MSKPTMPPVEPPTPPVEPPIPPTEPPVEPPTPPAPPTPEKTFTQAQIDAQKKAWEKDWAKKVADADAKAKLSEDEKTKAELAEANNKLRERDITDSFTGSAKEAGADAKNVSRLLKLYRADLEISDDGKIDNLKEILETAKEEMPEFFPSITPGSGDGAEGKKEAKLSVSEQVDAEFAKTGRTNAFKL